MREKFAPFIKLCAPRLIRLPGQSLRGMRADALVPCPPSGQRHPITKRLSTYRNFAHSNNRNEYTTRNK